MSTGSVVAGGLALGLAEPFVAGEGGELDRGEADTLGRGVGAGDPVAAAGGRLELELAAEPMVRRSTGGLADSRLPKLTAVVSWSTIAKSTELPLLTAGVTSTSVVVAAPNAPVEPKTLDEIEGAVVQVRPLSVQLPPARTTS
jgi:hypothetical protein